MNEEDTFNALRKTPLLKLLELYGQSGHKDHIERDIFLSIHNWTWEEFYKAYYDEYR